MNSYFVEQPFGSYRVTADEYNHWIYLSFSPVFQTRTMLQEFDQILQTVAQRQFDALILDLTYAEDIFTTFNRCSRIMAHLSVSKHLKGLRFFAVVAEREDLLKLLKRYMAGIIQDRPALFVSRQVLSAVQWIQTSRLQH